MKNGTNPNILWVVLDTVRADHLSCSGYARETTPFIRELARESTLYRRAISPSTWTPPSHASMFTGLFPSRHGLDGRWRWLDRSATTVAKFLHRYGYQTALFTSNPYLTSVFHLDQGFEISQYFSLGTQFPVENRSINSTVKEYMRNHGKINPESPFFIFINYCDVHFHFPDGPYGKTPLGTSYFSKASDLSPEKVYEVTQSIAQNWFEYSFGTTPVGAMEASVMTDLYDGALLYADALLRDLIRFVQAEGILDKTLLVITSDHGEHLGEHGLLGHEGGVSYVLTHVPLLVRYPPLFAPGTVHDSYVQTTDIFSTLLDILQIEDNDRPELQGFSLLDSSRPAYAISESGRGPSSFEFSLPPQKGSQGVPLVSLLPLQSGAPQKDPKLFSWIIQEPWSSRFQKEILSLKPVIRFKALPFKGFEQIMYSLLIQIHERFHSKLLPLGPEKDIFQKGVETNLLRTYRLYLLQKGRVRFLHQYPDDNRFEPMLNALALSKEYWTVLLDTLFPTLPKLARSAILQTFQSFKEELLSIVPDKFYQRSLEKYLSLLQTLQSLRTDPIYPQLLAALDFSLSPLYGADLLIPALYFSNISTGEAKRIITAEVMDILKERFFLSPDQEERCRPYVDIFVEKMKDAWVPSEKTSYLPAKEQEIKRLSQMVDNNHILHSLIRENILSPLQRDNAHLDNVLILVGSPSPSLPSGTNR